MNATKESLERLIRDQIEESQVLEYKAAPSLDRNAKAEITKDVSAFANAQGGTVVYGIAEFRDPERKHLPERLDPVNQLAFSREWLDQILGLIQPRIPGLEIVPIHVGPSVADYCYVVNIPAGETAHQATDLRYYKRRNFESPPMQDYEIRDVMNRRRDPKLEVKIWMDYLGAPDFHWHVTVNATNTSTVIAHHIQVIADLPPILDRRLIGHSTPIGSHMTRPDGFQSFRVKFRNKSGPLFAGDTKSWSVKLERSHATGIPPEWGDPRPLKNFCYQAFADQMKMIEGEFLPTEVVRSFPEPSLSVNVLTAQADVNPAL